MVAGKTVVLVVVVTSTVVIATGATMGFESFRIMPAIRKAHPAMKARTTRAPIPSRRRIPQRLITFRVRLLGWAKMVVKDMSTHPS